MRIHVLKVAVLSVLLIVIVGEVGARLAGYPERIQPVSYVEGVGHTLNPVTVFDADAYGGECKVLLIGDSILSAMRPDMEAILGAAVEADPEMAACQLTNVSIGGWSPSGIQKWIDRFGWMNADRVIFVFNTDDLDQPSFNETRRMSETYDRHDRLAIAAWFKSQILRRVDNRLHFVERFPGAGKADMDRLLIQAENEVPRVEIVWHPRLEDSLAHEGPPRDIVAIANRINAPLTALDYEPKHYSDRIHLTAEGRQRLVEQLGQILGQQRPTAHTQLLP